MTTKGIFRYLISIFILMVVLSIALPLAGIPRQVIIAPPLAYLQAGGTTSGYVTSKDTSPTANVFHVGDKDFFVRYRFKGPALPPMGQHVVAPGATAVYLGHAQVSEAFYGTAAAGQTVPVRFEPGDPVINGISAPGGGRNGDGAASIVSAWVLWDIAILVVAYPLAMLLERIMLRESY